MRPRTSVVVGRDRELSAMGSALACARDGTGGAVFLVGEPGIGKSRLAAEMADYAFAAGMRLLRGRGSTIGPMVPFRPLSEALLSLLRDGDPVTGRELGPYRQVLGRLIPEWGGGEAGTGDLNPGTGSLVVLAEAVLRLVGLVGRDRGCLLLIDDLQDVDLESLAVVEYLADNLERQPALLIGTARPGPGPASDLIRSVSQRKVGQLIELGRLTEPDLEVLTASYLDTEPQDVPPAVLDRVLADSAGNPFVAEELLNGMIGCGVLVRGAAGWRVAGEIQPAVPVTFTRSVVQRVGQLGAPGRELMYTAAVIGRRFPLFVLPALTGLDDRAVLGYLQAALRMRLVEPDDQAPDWYAFRHPLTVEALLGQLPRARREEFARRAADQLELSRPGLPGDWCQLAAKLRIDAGDTAAAALLLADAGRRAFASGAASSAVALLSRARSLLAEHPDAGPDAPGHVDSGTRADIIEALLYALAETGQFAQAVACANDLDGLGGVGLDPARRSALHTRLAWVAVNVGRWDDCAAQIRAARAGLAAQASDELIAPVDAVEAYQLLEVPGGDRLAAAEALARRAATVADRVPLPLVACQAWQLVGALARSRDLFESSRCFERVNRIAQEHQLPIWQLHATHRLGENDALLDGDLSRLRQAGERSLQLGAVLAGCETDANIAMQVVLRGDYPEADLLVDQCLSVVERLRIGYLVQFLLATRAVSRAHQGRRREMDRAVARFRGQGGDRSRYVPLVLGLGRTFCALLEEDRERARCELARVRAAEDGNPSVFCLTGRYGLAPLLESLAEGGATRDGEKGDGATGGGERGDGATGGGATFAAASVQVLSQLRWNRQFHLLAGAVRLGRRGHAEEATEAVAQAQHAAAPYRMARHLGLRLVAEAAVEDGWGDPVTWLGAAEEFFHEANVPAVASACRALLRRTGNSPPQRRQGAGRVPLVLRSAGVTVREFEVLQLLSERLGNRAIAGRLHLSPRTVEKHVASLMMKTEQPDRAALAEYATTTVDT